SEITSAEQRRRHCHNQAVVLPILGALITTKEKQLVLDDRAAQCSAVLVLNEFALRMWRWAEIVSGLQGLIGVIFESGAMKIICPALDLDVDGCAARQSLLSIKAVGDNVDRLDCFERRHVRRDVRQPDI